MIANKVRLMNKPTQFADIERGKRLRKLSASMNSHQALKQNMMNSNSLLPSESEKSLTKQISFQERLKKINDPMICGLEPTTNFRVPTLRHTANLSPCTPEFFTSSEASGSRSAEHTYQLSHKEVENIDNSSLPLSGYPVEGVEQVKLDVKPTPRARWQKAIKQVMYLVKFGLLGDELKINANLFGKCEVTSKKRAQNKICCMLIYPGSKVRTFWNFIYLLCLLFLIIYVPVRLAFLEQISFQMIMTECTVDGFCFLDIFVNFLSAYYDEDHNLITQKSLIAKKYLKSWFIFDLCSCFPISLFESNCQPEPGDYPGKLIRLVRLLKLYRIIKTMKSKKAFNVLKRNPISERIIIFLKMNARMKHLFNAVLLYFFAIHFFASIWFYAARFQDFHQETWVLRYGLRDIGPGNQYLISYFWSMTLTTIGYADILPYTNTERLLALLYIIVGVGFVSYTIGSLSTIMLTSDSNTEKLKEKLLVLDEIAMNLNMSPDLYYRIKTIIRNNHQTNFYSDMTHEALMDELPTNMRSQLSTLIFKQNGLDSIAFFNDKSPEFLNQLLPLIKRVWLGKNELIYRVGDWVDEMYFIRKGDVKLVSSDNFMYRQYIGGSYFGEADILDNYNFRSESVLTGDNCELLVLKKRDLVRLLEEHEDVRQQMLLVNQKRESKNKESLKLARQRNVKLTEDLVEKLNSGLNTIFNASYVTQHQTAQRRQTKLLNPDLLNKEIDKQNEIEVEYAFPISTNHPTQPLNDHKDPFCSKSPPQNIHDDHYEHSLKKGSSDKDYEPKSIYYVSKRPILKEEDITGQEVKKANGLESRESAKQMDKSLVASPDDIIGFTWEEEKQSMLEIALRDESRNKSNEGSKITERTEKMVNYDVLDINKINAYKSSDKKK